MTRPPIISSKEIVKALRAAGFENAPKRGKGSHIAMMKRDQHRTRLVIIPDRKNIPRGTSPEGYSVLFWIRPGSRAKNFKISLKYNNQ